MPKKNEIIPVNSTTFEVELSGGDKVEVGDKEAVDFKPHLKLNRWGGECFIKMGLPLTEKITPILEDGKVKGGGNKVDIRLYPLEPTTVNELGGFEFEIVLKEKPTSNQIVFDIQARGLRFAYQPPLSQQEIDAGTKRPENVVGSYAVYHATKKNNQYMTGKAFHIYRPQAEDALGNKIWCSLYIDGHTDPKKLTVTVPQQFINEAVYPVTIDPDLGYTGTGNSWAIIGNGGNGAAYSKRCGSAWTMPVRGTANFIRAYIRDMYAVQTPDCRVFINQKDSVGAGSHGQIAVKENLACAAAAHWEEFTLASEVLTGEVTYILSILADKDDLPADELYEVAVDSMTPEAVASYSENNTYGAEESPWVVAAEGTTWDYSIYCNYSVAAAVEPKHTFRLHPRPGHRMGFHPNLKLG